MSAIRAVFALVTIAGLLAVTGAAAERIPVVPAGAAPPVGPYTPGILAGKFLYVSGQGVRGADNTLPPTLEAQTRQCLENVKQIVEAAGLSLEHVVHTQLYLTSAAQLPTVERIYGEYFASSRPARTTVIAARLPTDTTIELTAVAVRDLNDKRILPGTSPGGPHTSLAVWGAGRLYTSSLPAASLKEARRWLRRVLARASLRESHVVFRNEFAVPSARGGNTPVAALPGRARYAVAAIASPDAEIPPAPSHPCRATPDAIFCAVMMAKPEARDIAEGASSILESLRQNLAPWNVRLQDAVAANVYVNDLAGFAAMNAAYKSFFDATPPTRTTIQPRTPSPRQPVVGLSLFLAR